MDSEKLTETFRNTFDVLAKTTQKPEEYLSVQSDVAKRLRDATKKLYDLTKSVERAQTSDALPELIVEGFDDEQIWQELELQNEPSVSGLVGEVSRVAAGGEVCFQKKKNKRKKKKKTVKKEIVAEEGSEDGVEDEAVEHGEAEKEEEKMEAEDDEEGGGLFDDDDENEEEMSEDEKEMVRLLAKAEAMDKEEGSSEDEEEDPVNDDFVLGAKQTKKDSDKPRSSHFKGAPSLLDDKFFKLGDLENFLNQEDAKEERKIARESGKFVDDDDSSEDEEEIDYFRDIPSEEEGEESQGIRYSDFFDPPEHEAETYEQKQKKKVQFKDPGISGEEDSEDNQEDSDDDEGENVADILGSARGEKSSFEKRQERLKQKISSMEDAALEDAPWQLRGEVKSTARPENSLLQEDLDHEHNVRPAPVITEETTKSLEDIIKQRIKDKTFDDVERKVKPRESAAQYKKRIVLDQEKSKLSLGEIYEAEYVKQQRTSGAEGAEEEEDKVEPQRQEITKSMTALFVKLDALSNFHYTPKQAVPDVKIVSNLPSVAMEEVAPVSVSDANLLAPEEIQAKQKGDLKGDSEKNKTDRANERRAKKKRQAAKHAAQEARLAEMEKEGGVREKVGKEKALRELEKQSRTARGLNIIKDTGSSKKSGLTSSAKFFTQLQDEVTTNVRSKKAAKKQKKGVAEKSAKDYKL